MALPDLDFTKEDVLVENMTLDNRVNPRDPSESWVHKQVAKYNRGLLGVFILSERLPEGGDRQLIVLDGANRRYLVQLADDAAYPVPSLIYRGLSLAEEAQVAKEYNDRRNWTGMRKFQTLVTMGDPVACRIEDLFKRNDWEVGTGSGNGVIRGVAPIERLLTVAGQWAAAQAKARKGTEAWHAAMENGKDDAFRVLEQAIGIYNIAFREKPSGYAPDIMHGISLVLLRYEGRVDLERLTQHLRDESRGQRSFRNDARATADTYKLPMTHAYAFQTVVCYNVGFKGRSREALPTWEVNPKER